MVPVLQSDPAGMLCLPTGVQDAPLGITGLEMCVVTEWSFLIQLLCFLKTRPFISRSNTLSKEAVRCIPENLRVWLDLTVDSSSHLSISHFFSP